MAKDSNFRRRGSAALLLALVPLVPSMTAAQGLPALETEIGGNTVMRFSGQLNFGILSYDDGGETNTYAPVDNDNSSSRVRLQFFSDLGEWDMEATFEGEYQPRASNVVSQLDDEPDWGLDEQDIRKIEASFASERWGTLWFGQGSMASDNTAEVDLSGTTVIAYSSLSDTAGGQFFRLDDGALSGVTVGSAFTNFDGLGRKVRIRYDSPSFNGFQMKTSYGQDLLNDNDASLYDLVATYGGEFESFEVAGAVAYSWNEGTDVDRLDGSVSALHAPTGLSLTFAAGSQQNAGSGDYGYAKFGYEREFFSLGSTAFSLDYYGGNDIASEGSDSTSWGLAAVQNIDSANLQLWLVWRNYAYEDDAGAYEDGNAIFGGARWRF